MIELFQSASMYILFFSGFQSIQVQPPSLKIDFHNSTNVSKYSYKLLPQNFTEVITHSRIKAIVLLDAGPLKFSQL